MAASTNTLAPESASTSVVGQLARWVSTTSWGGARWQRGLAAAVAALIFWTQSSVDPAVGLNPSWQAGPALARIHHLAWGPQILFTYGPLGFLQNSVYYSFEQSLLATIYQPIVVAALFLGIAAALRQRHAPMTSLIGAFATTAVVAILHTGHGLAIPGLEYPELAILAAFAWAAVPLLQQHPPRSTVSITCTALAAVAGFQLLVKLNAGLTIVVIALAVSVLLDWRAVGRHGATLTAFAASTLLCWVLAGQPPGNLPAWLKYSAAVITGYSDGMAVPLSAFAGMAAPAIVVSLAWMAALGVLLARGGPQTPRRFVVFVALVTAMVAKKEFVRLDITSFYGLLGFIVVAAAITPLSGLPRISRRALVGVVAAVVVVGLGAESAALRAVGATTDDPVIAAVQAPVQALNRLATLAVPGRLDQRVDHAKAAQRALYGIPDRFLTTIGSAPVHIDPTEASAAWAYDFAWRPAPVFQTYSAYTPALDALNSRTLASGPRFVLSRRSPTAPATGIDGRLGVQESPRYSRTLLCDYTLSGVATRWALFTRSGPHCGPLTALSQADVRGGEQVSVPAPSGPNMAVLVGIDLAPSITDRLFQGAVLPLSIPTVILDGVAYRLVAANAAEPFLLTSPASVAGTNLQIHTHTIGVGRAPSLGQGDLAARLRFYQMQVAP